MGVEQEIKDKARELGFDAVGITDLAPIGREHVERFEAWLQAGCAGRMEYMRRNVEKRLDPGRLRKGGRSAIVVALNYKPASMADSASHDSSPTGTSPACVADTARYSQTQNSESAGSHVTGPPIRNPVGRVAMYAQYEDYHRFLKDLLRELAGFLCMRTGRQDRFKICVDSAPVAEKALAARAGLGFIGKNHLLIHPQLGPQILLGELLTSVPLQPDQPTEGTCRGCTRCLEACPTGALRPDGLLDARRCLSYLTQYGSPEESVGRTDNWLFGCDECLRACPFQQSAPACANRRFKWYAQRVQLNLHETLKLSPEEFEARFHDSPVRRIGLERIKHNARRCLESEISNPEGI